MRRRLTAEDTVRIIREWDEKSYEDFASDFGVAVNTVRAMATEIRKECSNMCPKKSRKTRRDTVLEALQILDDTAED